MTERHHGQMVLRTSPATTGYRYLESTDAPDPSKWREAANGKPDMPPYVRSSADAEREAEVAARLAAARAEALRRARAWLGPGPLQRRVTNGTRAAWELIGEDEGASA